MTQQHFNREFENHQIRMRNEEIIRGEQRAAELRGRMRGQNSHVIANVLSVLAASLWVVAVIALYDVVVVQVSVLEWVVARVPAGWVHPEWWGLVLKAAVALVIASPLFGVAFVLKKMREWVGYRFPLSRWAVLPLWCWMVLATSIRAVVDLLGIAVAWVAFQLLREVEVSPVTELGAEALWGALVLIVPAAIVRAFVLTSQMRSIE